MKKTVISISVLAVAFASCSKVNQILVDTPENNGLVLVPMTFSANLPMTKTVLSDNTKVLWDAEDELNVIEVDADGKLVGEHPFTLSSGDGTDSATFSGEVTSTSNTFYAVYPNIKLYESPASVGTTIELKNLGQAVEAIENSYDPKMAVMTAVVDEEGKLAFRHAMAYIKFTANSSDIVSVKLTAAGGARIYGRPVITIADGAPSAVNGTGSNSNLTMSGVFVSGSSYIFPITIKPNNKLGELTFLATSSSGATSTVSTTSLSNLIPEAGKIYKVGQIPFSFAPVISYEAPAKLGYDVISGSFTYSISNAPEGALASAEITSGSWITGVSVSGNTVSFTCEKNDAADAEERSAVITLSYSGAVSVPVTITQGINGSVLSETYDWTFSAMSSQISGLGSEYLGSDGKFVNGKTFTISGLSYTTSSGTGTQSSWDSSSGYIRAGGKGSETQRFFSFTINTSGTLTVSAASTGSNSRAIYVNGTKHATTVSSSKTPVDFVFSVSAGTITVYPGDGDMCVYSIKYSSN